MGKRQHDDAPTSGPIARKVIAQMKRHQNSKVVSLGDFVKRRSIAEQLQQTVVSLEAVSYTHLTLPTILRV